MGTLIVLLEDRHSFADLDRTVILLPTEEQERKHARALAQGHVRKLVDDPAVERIGFRTEFLRRLLRSRPPRF